MKTFLQIYGKSHKKKRVLCKLHKTRLIPFKLHLVRLNGTKSQICQIFQLRPKLALPTLLINLVLERIMMQIESGRLGYDCPIFPKSDNDVLQLI